MARTCTVCAHPEREAIDLAIVGRSDSIRAISRQFTVTKDALARHAGSHISDALTKATEAATVTSADGLLARVRALEARVVRALDLAEHGKDYRGVFAGARELREVLRLLAELVGKLQPAGTSVQVVTVNVEYTPDQLEHLAELAIQEAADMRRTVVTTTGNSALPELTEPSFPGAATTETTELGRMTGAERDA